jgi:hypothetical protein
MGPHLYGNAWPFSLSIGTAAAIGLVLFFVCADYTHLLARDFTPQFGLAIGFLLLAVDTLVLDLTSSSWGV